MPLSGSSKHSVTLIDTIVFADANGANDPVLWAHELKHVQQFRDWGVMDFSIRYIRSYNGVEDQAYGAEEQFRQIYSQRDPLFQNNQATTQVSFGNFCNVNGMIFGPGPGQPKGSPCWVGTPNGPVWGVIN